jgi:PAS domain S-box-containing protein
MQKKSGILSGNRSGKASEARERNREADAQLRAVVNSSPTPTLVSRMEDGNIIYANEHLARLVGLTIKELIGRASTDFYYSPHERASLLDRVRRDQLLRNCELRLKRADGTAFWALISCGTKSGTSG